MPAVLKKAPNPVLTSLYGPTTEVPPPPGAIQCRIGPPRVVQPHAKPISGGPLAPKASDEDHHTEGRTSQVIITLLFYRSKLGSELHSGQDTISWYKWHYTFHPGTTIWCSMGLVLSPLLFYHIYQTPW